MYALIIDDTVAQYPYTLAQLQAANPLTIIPLDSSDDDLAEWGMVAVAPSDPHAVTPEQEAEEATPALVEGVWTQQWTVRERTAQELAEAKAALRAQVNVLRDQRKSVAPSPIGLVDSGVESRLNISGAVQMAQIAMANGQPFSIDWTLADNSIAIAVDGPSMIAVGVATGQHVAACHAVATGIKQAIDDAASFTDLAAIDIDAGWPS